MMTAFEQATLAVHHVEDEWHYPILTAHGYSPMTTTATGFVRSYIYQHSATGHLMRLATGASADYWEDQLSKKRGYHGELAGYLKSLIPAAE